MAATKKSTSTAKKKVKEILSIPGLDAQLDTDGNTFTLTGKVQGDAFDIVKEAIADKSNSED